jgi:prefoldin subunit 5
MQVQAKRVYEKAIQIYHTEIDGVARNGSNKNLSSISKTHKQLEEELRKLLQKELKGYSQLNELTEKMLVTICFNFNRSR